MIEQVHDEAARRATLDTCRKRSRHLLLKTEKRSEAIAELEAAAAATEDGAEKPLLSFLEKCSDRAASNTDSGHRGSQCADSRRLDTEGRRVAFPRGIAQCHVAWAVVPRSPGGR
jgi:hypothetical protein